LPTYSYLTQAQALQQLANRLFNPAMVFWTSAELVLYLNEALQTWNALTGYWRNDFTFPAQAGVTFYDMTDSTQMPNTLRSLNVTDADLYEILEYHLLEPATGINPWTGSKQFSAADFVGAVQRRRDEILSITGCTQTRSVVPAVAGRIQLADNVIDVRRMAYLPSSLFPGQLPSVVWPDDTWAEQSFNRLYTLTPAGTPFTYLMSTQPPIAFDTDKPPAYAGQYELLTVNAGPALSVSTPSLLSIPDDWTHVLKWGALADLLSREWEGKDIPRAAYCEQRYRLGLAAMRAAPALLAIRDANVGLQIDSIRSADLYNTSWQALTPATPSLCFHSGLNLIALAPQPNATIAALMMATVVENAPLPTAPTDFVQVGRDELSAIVDYAQHLAAFKQGGAEFTQSIPLFQRFLKQCAIYNAKLSELGEYTSMLEGVSQMEASDNPVMTPAGEQVGTS
jgi:hypothetical protein